MRSARNWIAFLLLAALLLWAVSGPDHTIISDILLPVLLSFGLVTLAQEPRELCVATVVTPFRNTLPARAPPLS